MTATDHPQRIFHIARRSDWDRAAEAGHYEPAGLANEGFIHCSTAEQVEPVANALFEGADDLVLLTLDPALLDAPLRWDAVETGERFPHVYGPLNLDAVVASRAWAADTSGRFTLPEGS